MKTFVITTLIAALFLIPYGVENVDTQPINHDTAYKLIEDKIEM